MSKNFSVSEHLIIKAQRPLFTNDEEPKILLYGVNRDGDHISNDVFIPADETNLKKLKLDKYVKTYWNGYFEYGTVSIGSEAWVDLWVEA